MTSKTSTTTKTKYDSLYGPLHDTNTTTTTLQNNRPRRPNPETLAYLQSLPLDEESLLLLELPSQTTNSSPPPPPSEDQVTATTNAILSIPNEIASLAGDELGSERLETLSRIATRIKHVNSIRILLNGIRGYALHLATHRYGSHVLQTVLRSAQTLRFVEEIGEEEEEEEGTMSSQATTAMDESVVSIAEELIPHCIDLSIHVCGSHALRTLICVLAGVEPLGESTWKRVRQPKPNKKKKKKKKIDNEQQQRDDATPYRNESTKFQPVSYNSNTRSKFQTALNKLCTQLIYTDDYPQYDPSRDLIDAVCHPSASPLYALLLRALTVSQQQSFLSSKPRFQPQSQGEHFVQTLLSWGDEHACRHTLRTLSVDSIGSTFLETVLETCHDAFHAELLEKGRYLDLEALGDYVSHDVANYVLQTAIATLRTRRDAERCLKMLLSERGLLREVVVKRRRGVLWRMVESCAIWRVCQETLLVGIRSVMGGEDGGKVPLAQCVELLVGLERPRPGEGDRKIRLDANGTKTVSCLLKFVPRLCGEVLDGILEYEVEDLVMMAKDGLGSRCLFDTILEHPHIHEHPFSEFLPRLLRKLQSHWIRLSTDRIGHHIVMKVFRVASFPDKEIMAQELSQKMNPLKGNAMGRKVMEVWKLQDFIQNKRNWRDAMKKMEKQREWLEEIVKGEEEEEEEGLKKKKKRKRRRKGKDVGEDGGDRIDDEEEEQRVEDEEENDDDEQEVKVVENDPKTGTTTSVVGSIMDTLLPSSKQTFEKKQSMKKSKKKSKRKKK